MNYFQGCKWSLQQLRRYLVAKHGIDKVGTRVDTLSPCLEDLSPHRRKSFRNPGKVLLLESRALESGKQLKEFGIQASLKKNPTPSFDFFPFRVAF